MSRFQRIQNIVIGVGMLLAAGCLIVEPEDGLVTCWKSPDPGYAGTYTYCGLARLSPAMLDYVAPTGFSTIIHPVYRRRFSGHRPVYALSRQRFQILCNALSDRLSCLCWNSQYPSLARGNAL